MPRNFLLLRNDANNPIIALGQGNISAVQKGERKDEAAVVVGVLTNKVRPARSRPYARWLLSKSLVEEHSGMPIPLFYRPGRDPLRLSPSGGLLRCGSWLFCAHDATSFNRSVMFSGVVSEIQAPIPDSDPARYFNLSGARRIEKICRCRRESSATDPRECGALLGTWNRSYLFLCWN